MDHEGLVGTTKGRRMFFLLAWMGNAVQQYLYGTVETSAEYWGEIR